MEKLRDKVEMEYIIKKWKDFIWFYSYKILIIRKVFVYLMFFYVVFY